MVAEAGGSLLVEHTLQSLQRLRGAEEEDRQAQEEAGGSVGRAVVSGGRTATGADKKKADRDTFCASACSCKERQ